MDAARAQKFSTRPRDAEAGRIPGPGAVVRGDVVVVQSGRAPIRQNPRMAMPATRRRPISRTWPPAARWSDHVCMFVVRDTRGCDLDEHEQFNRFPANPYCCITWMLEGRVRLVAQGDAPRGALLPAVFVHGCQTRPCESRNEGERLSFCVVVHPDAFHALFGLDLEAIQDAFADASEILPEHGLGLVADVAAARSDADRGRIVDAFLARHAQVLATRPWTRLRRMGVNISLRVAGGLLGVGPRQAQRLARREGGMNVPGLSRLWRGERSLRLARASLARGQAIAWAEHAADAGYADQSHLVRDCKAISGRTPAQIARQAPRDEADWVYRL
jgi:AraC-like DNA-binding protein